MQRSLHLIFFATEPAKALLGLLLALNFGPAFALDRTAFDTTTEQKIQAWLQNPSPLPANDKIAYREFITAYTSHFPIVIQPCSVHSQFLVRYLGLPTQNPAAQNTTREIERNQEQIEAAIRKIQDFCSGYNGHCPPREEFQSLKFSDYPANTTANAIAHSLPPLCKSEAECTNNRNKLKLASGSSGDSQQAYEATRNYSFGIGIVPLLAGLESLLTAQNHCKNVLPLMKKSDSDFFQSEEIQSKFATEQWRAELHKNAPKIDPAPAEKQRVEEPGT